MKQLWAPWRMEYITAAPEQKAGTSTATGCPFCDSPASTDPTSSLLLYLGPRTSVIMNRYPYGNGHLMVSPLAHVADLSALDAETSLELFNMTKSAVRILTESMTPEGFNIGMNLGTAAGAGIAEHMHMHVVPRWNGDTNFMPILSDTRVVSEHIDATYAKLKPLFDSV